jgi:hypothetical protein
LFQFVVDAEELMTAFKDSLSGRYNFVGARHDTVAVARNNAFIVLIENHVVWAVASSFAHGCLDHIRLYAMTVSD